MTEIVFWNSDVFYLFSFIQIIVILGQQIESEATGLKFV